MRDAIAAKFERTQGVAVDPEREITVCCGSTEAMMSSMMAIINPGDEVVVFEPFYENYGPDAILSGATPRFVKLRPPDWTFDPDELAAAFGPATKAIILNTPNNPTGKVFERAELEIIRDLCVRWNTLRHHRRDLRAHALRRRASTFRSRRSTACASARITINALSKTYSVTGWRVGWAIAPPEVTAAIRKVHDFLTVGAAAPLQEAGAVAMQFAAKLLRHARARIRRRAATACWEFSAAPDFNCFKPRGAYYIMTDISAFGFPDDVAFAKYLVKEIGVAAVPGSSFYRDPADGRKHLRFTFCKKEKTFQAAAERLAKLSAAPAVKLATRASDLHVRANDIHFGLPTRDQTTAGKPESSPATDAAPTIASRSAVERRSARREPETSAAAAS